MKRTNRILALAMALVAAAAGSAMATPATQIWIPATDVRDFGQIHIDVDNYLRISPGKSAYGNVYDFGVGVGVLPFEKVKMEVGVDYLVNNATDAHPLYFNAKIGTPEDSLFRNSPALAVGGYNFGTERDVTDYNMTYALAAKTLPVIGRLSAGYYLGNPKVLVDPAGDKDNHGVLLSWDRTMSEISDKLWAAVDYQGGDNGFGALSFGVAWSFTPKVSLIVGYDIYNSGAAAGNNTVTTQLDINIP